MSNNTPGAIFFRSKYSCGVWTCVSVPSSLAMHEKQTVTNAGVNWIDMRLFDFWDEQVLWPSRVESSSMVSQTQVGGVISTDSVKKFMICGELGNLCWSKYLTNYCWTFSYFNILSLANVFIEVSRTVIWNNWVNYIFINSNISI